MRPRKKVLLHCAEENFAMRTRLVLDTNRFAVTTAEYMDEAMSVCRTWKPDVVLSVLQTSKGRVFVISAKASETEYLVTDKRAMTVAEMLESVRRASLHKRGPKKPAA